MYMQTVQKRNKSLTYTLPAPVKGLNKRDSIADMECAYAIVMDNYILKSVNKVSVIHTLRALTCYLYTLISIRSRRN